MSGRAEGEKQGMDKDSRAQNTTEKEWTKTYYSSHPPKKRLSLQAGSWNKSLRKQPEEMPYKPARLYQKLERV